MNVIILRKGERHEDLKVRGVYLESSLPRALREAAQAIGEYAADVTEDYKEYSPKVLAYYVNDPDVVTLTLHPVIDTDINDNNGTYGTGCPRTGNWPFVAGATNRVVREARGIVRDSRLKASEEARSLDEELRNGSGIAIAPDWRYGYGSPHPKPQAVADCDGLARVVGDPLYGE